MSAEWENVGTDRLLLGSDYPFWRDDAFQLCVDYVRDAGFSKEEVEAILGGNAERLLGLKAASASELRTAQQSI